MTSRPLGIAKPGKPRNAATLDVRDPDVQRALVARIRGGDAQAFAIVFDAYFDRLTRLATRCVRSPEMAHDVVHDVFLKIWRTRESWTVETSLAAYLFVVTRNAALSAARRDRLESRWMASAGERDGTVSGETVAADVADDAPLPDAIAEAHDRETAIANAADALPPRCREAFLLRWREQLTYPEVAAVMGTSVKTVERHLGAAFKTLRRALKPWGSKGP